MSRTATRTFTTLPVSPAAYEEIRTKLLAAGYPQTARRDGAIDMHGIAVVVDQTRCGRCGGELGRLSQCVMPVKAPLCAAGGRVDEARDLVKELARRKGTTPREQALIRSAKGSLGSPAAVSERVLAQLSAVKVRLDGIDAE